jgi:TRAP-type C4-dicarboxylate transport system permease small subunit
MKLAYLRAMDALYLFCVGVSGIALVLMTLVIPYGVWMRYVMNNAAAWPEPMSVLLVIVFTFFAGAACYRAGVHISVGLLVDNLTPFRRRLVLAVAEACMAVLAVFMVIWGVGLVEVTWHQVIAEFPFLSVGLTYTPIPLGGAFTLLFLLERAWIGPPRPDSFVFREPAALD